MCTNQKFATTHRILHLSNAVIWFRNQTLKKMDLTSTQSDAIRYILKNYEESDVTAIHLMKNLSLSQSTVAGIIKRLEAKGLLARRTDEKDNRKVILSPTEKGLRLEEYLKSTAVETERIMLQGMTAQEQTEFCRLLDIALGNMRTARGFSKEVQNEYQPRII